MCDLIAASFCYLAVLISRQKLSPLKLAAEWSIGSHVPDYIKVTKLPMKTKVQNSIDQLVVGILFCYTGSL